MSSLLSTIRGAVRSGAISDALDFDEGEPDAKALNAGATNPETPPAPAATNPGGTMSAHQTPAGGANPAAAALAAAQAAAGGSQDGYKDGFTAAMERINSVMSADGIKGDARRMSAAQDLMKSSPDMSAEAVVAFVTANIPAAEAAGDKPAPKAGASSYEQQRVAAANLAMPGGGSAPAKAAADIDSGLNPMAVYSARRNASKGA